MEQAMDKVQMVVEGVYSARAARELAEKYEVEMPIITEVNRVLFEGKSADELVKKPEFLEWLKGGADSRPPKGESLQEVQLRLFKALRTIILDMMQNDILHTAVVTHAGIITNLIAGFGLPKIDPKELRPAPGEGYDILVTASLWQRSGAFEILGMTPYANN